MSKVLYSALLIVFAVAVFGDEEQESGALVYDADLMKSELSEKPHFIKFYAPWGGHCKHLAPTWRELGSKFNTEDDVVIAKVDCTVHTSVCSEQGVLAYPTLKFYCSDNTEGERYAGKRDLQSLIEFIRHKLHDAEKDEEEEIEADAGVQITNGLFELTQANFEKTTAEGNFFIKFYLPWCEHCKRLAPTWEELAKEFENDAAINIAKIDCAQHEFICRTHNVYDYPSLNSFKNGQKNDKFAGAWDLASLKSFAQKQSEAADAADSTEEKIPYKEEVQEKEEPNGSVLRLTSANFAVSVAERTTFVKFFAPWGGHCKHLAPTWHQLGLKFNTEDDVAIAKVDCTVHTDVCSEQGVSGYPTLKLFISDDTEGERYDGERDLQSLIRFIKDKVHTREKGEKEEEEEGEVPKAVVHVLDLTRDNFANSVSEGTTFVKFFAPWCGHCKRLAPTWEELGTKMESNKNIKIAQVDCTENKDVCKDHGVRGYPTLIIFRNGEKLQEHNGGRDLDSLSKFVLESLPHDEL